MIILGRKVVNKNWNQPPEALLYNIESLHKCIPFPFAVNDILPAFKSGCTRLLDSSRCRYGFHQSDCNGFMSVRSVLEMFHLCRLLSQFQSSFRSQKYYLFWSRILYTVCIFASGMCMLMHRSSLACLGKWGEKKEILEKYQQSSEHLQLSSLSTVHHIYLLSSANTSVCSLFIWPRLKH